MELIGINVTQGEITYKQKYRVCIHGVDDSGSDFWTNIPEEGVDVA